MNNVNADGYTDGSVFHSSDSSVYSGTDADDGRYFKSASGMARVVYRNSHENADFPEDDPRHGAGLNFCRWITSEQPGTAEHFSFNGNLNAIIESRLEPGASFGLHTHYDTEEYYYILDGEIFVECRDKNGSVYGKELRAGDLHRISAGMSHYAKAGSEGVRFLAIIVRAG